MKRVATCSDRIREIMYNKRLRYVDIMDRIRLLKDDYDVTISRSQLSQYALGYAEPNDIRYILLADALQVSEKYLRGYNVDEEGNELQDVPDQARPSGFSSSVDPDTGHTVISIPSDALAQAVEMSTNEKRYIISQSINTLSEYDLDSLLMIIDRMKGRPGQ